MVTNDTHLRPRRVREAREALHAEVRQERHHADGGVERVVRREQHRLHAPELVPGQAEVQHYAWRRKYII